MTRAEVGNLSTLYRALPRDERAAAAAADGFARVESWWDFDSATPQRGELDGFLTSVETAGVELVAINSHGGDRDAGERGMACLPDRCDEFRASISSVCDVGSRTSARKFNVTFGQLDPQRWRRAEQFETAAANYRWAAEQVTGFGGTILVEALIADGNGGYPLHTGYDVVEFLSDHLADVDNVGFLFDAFHLAANGVDVVAAFRDLHAHVRHIQIADFPGRGAPGTGALPLDALHAEITAQGYDGDISLEYLG